MGFRVVLLGADGKTLSEPGRLPQAPADAPLQVAVVPESSPAAAVTGHPELVAPIDVELGVQGGGRMSVGLAWDDARGAFIGRVPDGVEALGVPNAGFVTASYETRRRRCRCSTRCWTFSSTTRQMSSITG